MLETRPLHTANEGSNSVWLSGQILPLRSYVIHALRKFTFDKKLSQ